VNFFNERNVSMDVNDQQYWYLLQSCDAALEAVRRRLKENDGRVALRVLESIIRPGSRGQQGKAAKKTSSWIPPQHIRVIRVYAQGKNLTEIARKEKLNRRTIMRVVRTAPFRVLELCGIIDLES
jgi:DNA-binding NarL/FixJ family response regulator